MPPSFRSATFGEPQPRGETKDISRPPIRQPIKATRCYNRVSKMAPTPDRWQTIETLYHAALGHDPARVVEMRFFGGLSVEETAEVLKVSPVTVMRDWSTAKAWLHRELTR